MKASTGGHTATVEVLLEAGADKDAKDEVIKRENHTHARVVDKIVWWGVTMWRLFPSLWLRLLVVRVRIVVELTSLFVCLFVCFPVVRESIKESRKELASFFFLLFSWRGREASQPLPLWLRAYFLLVALMRSLTLLFYSFLFPRGERAKSAKKQENACFPFH